jgi:hypothetical protein
MGTAEDAAEAVMGTAEDAAEAVMGTAEDAAEAVMGIAEVTDSNTYLGSDEDKEKRDHNESGGKEPMNPKDIAVQEPTASRDQDTEIAGEGETGADSPEAREKFRKKGMMET